MKKLLFIALFGLGLFGAQSISAQDTITARYFNHVDVDITKNGTYVVAFAENDNEQCVDSYLEQILTWNAATNTLSIDGVSVPPFTDQVDINYWNGVFANSSLFVFPVNSSNNVSGALILGVEFN